MTYDDLRTKALEATPGPWSSDGTLIHGPDKNGPGTGDLIAWPTPPAQVSWSPRQRTQKEQAERDAAYIAAAHPQRILDLLDELDEIRNNTSIREIQLDIALEDAVTRIHELEEFVAADRDRLTTENAALKRETMSLRNALGNCPYADHLTDWLANHPQFRAALATPARGWCEIHGNYECREDHSALATPATAEKT